MQNSAPAAEIASEPDPAPDLPPGRRSAARTLWSDAAGRASALRRSPVLRRIAVYGASRFTTEALIGLRGVVLARLLGPSAYGVWALFRIAMRWATSAGLGVNRGLERELSAARRSSGSPLELEHARCEADRYARAGVGFKLLVFGTISVGALLASLAVEDPEWRLGLRGFAAAVLTSQLVTYSVVYTHARGLVRRYAWTETAGAAFHLTGAAVGALVGGIQGAFAGFVAASLASVALYVGHVPLRPIASPARVLRLLRVGVPVSLTLATSTALATADRLIVAAHGGTELLGQYAFGVSVAGLATVFAWVVRTVVFPDVYAGVHATGTSRAVRTHLEGTLLPFARTYPLLLGVLALLIAPVVRILAPAYDDAVGPARLFIFSGATLGLVSLGSVGVVAADRQKRLPLFSVAGLLCNVALATAALRLGGDLTAVAAGALASQSVYGAGVVGLAARAGGLPRPARFVGRCYAPLAWCFLAVVLAIQAAVIVGGSAAPLVAAAVYALLAWPVAQRAATHLRIGRPRPASDEDGS